MKHQKTKKHNSHKGFTLVETIVVGVILVILLSFGAGMIVRYYHMSMYKKNNEYARAIFTSAQSSLTNYKVSGKLENLSDMIKGDSERLVTPAICGNENEGRIYYIDFTKEDYKKLKQSEDKLSDYSKVLYDLLKDYIYKTDIFNAAIRIEFDPVEGIVYSVCYSDRANQFDTDEASVKDGSDGTMGVSLANREDNRRYDIILGYYSTDALSDTTPANRERPAISKVELLNGETLSLQWSMSDKYKILSGYFTYNVQIYVKSDKKEENDEGKLFLSFTVNDKSGMDNTLQPEALGDNEIKCDVSYYDDAGNIIPGKEKEDIPFKAYMSRDGSYKMSLVLDAADIQAAGLLEVNSLSVDSYKGTYSALRLGLEPTQSIICKIQAIDTTEQYRPSSWKASSSEQQVFTGNLETIAGDKESRNYKIDNARHLFNIRFMEEYFSSKSFKYGYNQTNNIVWGGNEQGLIKHKNLYNGTTLVEDVNTAFPSIPELGKNAVYSGKPSSRQFIIAELRLEAEKNKSKEIRNEYLGLFRVNKGEIKNVTFRDVRVDGIAKESGIRIDYVGALCGINEGVLSGISVTGQNSHVTGGNFVGGIVGSDYRLEDKNKPGEESASDQELRYMSNSAAVSGIKYIGGIIGYSNSKAIIGCGNSGSITAAVSEADKAILSGNDEAAKDNVDKTYSYIGGIAGYKNKGEIVTCDSSFGKKRTGIELSELAGSEVGGIAGHLRQGDIRECSTSGGTILGGSYVGGIVGRSEDGNLNDGYQTNNADVSGRKYAGGVIGINDEGSNIKKWVNKGVVTASESYAGGITGLNRGEILDCSADVNTASESYDSLLKIYETRSHGSYIGGLVGCNEGTIGTEQISVISNVNSVVIGDSCIGGIIGWNKGNFMSKDYRLSGGYILGKVFVGGFIGLNQDADTLYQKMNASPNVVSGNYMVGGILGGNLSEAYVYSPDMQVTNYLGKVTTGIMEGGDNGGAFVGGVAGFNCLMDSAKAGETLKNALEEYLLFDSNRDLDTVVSEVDKIVADAANKADSESDKWHITRSKVKLQNISGGVYVGGILGYNAQESYVELVDCVNDTPVEATYYLSSGDKTSLDDTVNYAYAGGIAGKITENMTVSSCRIGNSGIVKTSDDVTYHGQLTEVNNGKIVKCTANAGGDYITDYEGGIAGRNNGIIQGCTLDGAIIGRDVIGGIAAENYGVISSYEDVLCTVNGNVYVYGQRGGGVAGYSSQDAEIFQCLIKGSVIGGSASSGIGGVIGYNQGTVKGVSLYTEANVLTTSIVSGGEYVGGIIGYLDSNGQENVEVSGLSSAWTVRAGKGYAGGIVGYISDSNNQVTVSQCKTSGLVTSENGIAGGITSTNGKNVTIDNCESSYTVSAVNGWAGGIAGENRGTISQCKTKDETVIGAYAVGGITAVNHGIISNTSIQDASLKNTTPATPSGELDSYGYCMGAVSGVNTDNAKIKACVAGEENNLIVISSDISKNYSGGITGRNFSEISDCQSFSDISTPRTGNYQNYLGGITGCNETTALIQDTEFVGTVFGDGGVEYGYGGIAGVNYGSILSCDASGTVSAAGDAGDIVNVGGIVGRQYSTGRTEKCSVGSLKETTIKSTNYGYVGGAIGYLDGIISEFNWSEDALEINLTANGTVEKTEPGKKVNVLIQRGHAGGVAGYAYSSGKLENCRTYSNWNVEAKDHATDNATGGIVGYSTTGDITYMVNHAAVKKNVDGSNSVGGILGRQENNTSNGWSIQKCINTGKVTGEQRVGGIIGQWKYKGGTIRECENYGEVKGFHDNNDDKFIAGILAFVYTADSGDYIDIVQCINHGSISSGTRVAGILSSMNNVSNLKIRINHCVNVGSVKGGSNAGIFSGADVGTKNEVYITSCSNYGNAGAGIFRNNGNNGGGPITNIKDCFGVSNVDYPISNKGNSVKNSYYFSNKDKGKGTRLNEIDKNAGTAGTKSNPVILSGIPFKEIPGGELPIGNDTTYLQNRQTYMALNPVLERYFSASDVEKPKEVSVKEAGGSYQVSWKSENDNYIYDIQADIYETQSEGQNAKNTPKTNADLLVSVRGGNLHNIIIPETWQGKYMNVFVTAKTSDGSHSSDAVSAEQNSMLVKKRLPTPQLHFELVGKDSKGYYKAVLDNYEEYENLSGIKLEDIKISISGPISENVSVKNIGNSLYSMGRKEPYTVKFQAKADNNQLYRQSAVRTYQTQIFNYGKLQGEDKLADASFVTTILGTDVPSITGLTISDMAVKVKLAQTGQEVFYRSELLLPDPALDDMEVVVASNDMRVSTTTSSAVSISLANLPEDLLRKVYSKENPTIKVRSFPWTTQNFIAYMGQKALIAQGITAQEVKAKYTGDENTGKGYVIVRNAKDNYNVYQCTILQYTTYANQVTQDELALPAEMPAPELKPVSKVNDNLFFKWDVNKSGSDYTNPEYQVILSGTTQEDKEVQILKETVTEQQTSEDGSKYYGISVDGSELEYKKLTMTVTRIGEKYPGNTDITKRMGSDSRMDYKLYLRLDTVPRPWIELKNNNKDELNYDITWKGITHQEQLKDLKEYQIKISSEEHPETSRVISVPADDTGIGRYTVDFDDFISNDTVQISVKAIAYKKEDKPEQPDYEPVYTDSREGIVLDFTIPERLETPDKGAEEWSMALLNNDEDGSIVKSEDIRSIEQFVQEGFKFKVDFSGSGKDTRGAYQMRAYIYDSDLVNGELPEDGLIENLTGENSQVVMDGQSLETGSYVFRGLSAQYAGKYLVLQIRSTSSQNISSHWSAYYSYQLPKLKLDAPSFTHVSDILLPVEKVDDTDNTILMTPDVEHDGIMWAHDELSSGYKVRIADLLYGEEFEFIIYRNESDGEFKVRYQPASESGMTELPLPESAVEADGSIVYECEVKDYGFTTNALNKGGNDVAVRFSLKVQIVEDTDGNISYKVILPDVHGLDGAEWLYTGSVTVCTLGDQDTYMDSLRTQWIRISANQAGILSSTIRQLEENNQIDMGISSTDTYAWMVLKPGEIPWNPDGSGSYSGKETNE